MNHFPFLVLESEHFRLLKTFAFPNVVLTRLNDHASGFYVQLKHNHTYIRRVDDLRTMGQRLGPQFGRRLESVCPASGQLYLEFTQNHNREC